MATLFYLPRAGVGPGLDVPNGAVLKFFENKTSTPKEVYSDIDASVSLGTEVTAAGNGLFPAIWLVGAYTVELYDMNGQLIYTVDDVQGTTATAFNLVSDMIAADLQPGQYVSTNNYGVVGDQGGATYLIQTSGDFGGTPDELGDHTLNNGNVAALRVGITNEISAKQCGILGDGTDENVAIYAFEDRLLAGGHDGYFPPGTYDVGVLNWPFRNPVTVSPSLLDYKGITIRGNREDTIFRTTSTLGADVLQLNAIENFTVKDVLLTAVLNGSGGSGSNGVSITNGGRNLYIDVDCINIPGLDKTTFQDGGKAFTIQNGASATNPYENITIRGNATLSDFAFNIDAGYNEFDIGGGPWLTGVRVDVTCSECWRGATFSAAAATAALADVDKDTDLMVKIQCFNVTQPLILSRWVRGQVDCHIMNSKPIANLPRPFAADQTSIAAIILGDYRSRVNIKGRCLALDNKLKIGGTTQGFGVFGGCDGTNLNFEVDCGSVASDEVDEINSGGNITKNSYFRLVGIADGTGTDLIRADNTVIFDSDFNVGNMRTNNLLSAERNGQVYDVFRADSTTNDIELIRVGSGAVGATAGFFQIKDTLSGTTYKVQLYL